MATRFLTRAYRKLVHRTSSFVAGNHLTKRMVLLLPVVLALAAVPAVTPALANSSNADAAHACQGNGYQTLQSSTGGTFKNAGDCTSYAARGGAIVGVGPTCTSTASSGCIVFDNVIISRFTRNGDTPNFQSPAVTYRLSGTEIFTPTCQLLAPGCDYSTIAITGTGTFSTSTGASGTWTASYSPPDPYSFTDASISSTTCATAAIQMVTSQIVFTGTASGGGFIEVRTDTSASGPFKNFVYGNFSTAGGTPTGEFLSDLTGVSVSC